MSVALLPDIGGLDPNSLCYAIYSDLYHNFFNAQDKKSDENPYGIVEGDDTSIRLRNTAYNFASAIAGAVAGEGSESGGGILLGYLKKTGGDMTGLLRAGYGFEAGEDNTRILRTYRETAGEEPSFGLQVYGDVRIGAGNLFIGGKNILRYSVGDGTAYIENPVVSFGASALRGSGEMLFGENAETGVVVSSDTVYIKNHGVYHAGNANLGTVDWSMKNAVVSGGLQVSGAVVLSGGLSALYGAKLGYGGKEVLSVLDGNVRLDGFLNIAPAYGVKIGEVPVLVRANESDMRLSCDNGNLLLGSDATRYIKLFTGLTDIDGDNVLITKYGGAYFPDSFRAAHNYGADLLSTYRVNDSDEGVIIHKRLRFGSAEGVYLSGDKTNIVLSDKSSRAAMGFQNSTSVLQIPDSGSRSFFVDADTDFITFGQPVEAKGHVGIDGSATRLADGHLYLSAGHYLMSGTDGIKHFGNAYFLGSLSSERFSSGFAGYGWAIVKNATTGSMAATFDEVVVRKKMRVYEMEVQRNYAANGSLWISDACSGDMVVKV